jgi:putative ABC transport system permease protein
LERVVLTHALYLSLISFFVGCVLSYASYQMITGLTGLVMRMTLRLTLLMLVLTVFMCTTAGALATRKVVSADPAEVF